MSEIIWFYLGYIFLTILIYYGLIKLIFVKEPITMKVDDIIEEYGPIGQNQEIQDQLEKIEEILMIVSKENKFTSLGSAAVFSAKWLKNYRKNL